MPTQPRPAAPDPTRAAVTPDRIRALRLALGEPQHGFGARFNVGERAVQKWESGECVPNKWARKLIYKHLRERKLL